MPRSLALTALGIFSLAVPSYGQIIATSIPREDVAAGAAGERKAAFHLMASPFAKWKINSYVEEPAGDAFPVFQQAATTDSASKFIAAAEVAFVASPDVTIGLGGWYNTLGTADVEIFEVDLPNAVVFAGAATEELNVWELHGNVFYKNVGLQLGIVRTSATLTGFLAGSEVLDLNTGIVSTFLEDVTLQEIGIPEDTQSATNWDAFLVYKRGAEGEVSTPWAVSVGAGIYRDSDAGSTTFSGFITGSVQLYRGLGLDASYWYVGGQDPTPARQELASLLDTAISSNLSRFTIGIGYSFSR